MQWWHTMKKIMAHVAASGFEAMEKYIKILQFT